MKSLAYLSEQHLMEHTDTEVILAGKKIEAQRQWESNPCGADGVKGFEPETIEWFRHARHVRFDQYAPWLPRVCGFDQVVDKDVLEIGVGLGCDHFCFAKGGNRMTALDISREHLRLTSMHLKLEGLSTHAVYGDAEKMPFEDNSFDVVYTFGVLHHTPDFHAALSEVHRVLRPGGRIILGVYHRHSLFFWGNVVLQNGLLRGGCFRHGWEQTLARIERGAGDDIVPLVRVSSRRALLRATKPLFETTCLRSAHVGYPSVERLASCLGVRGLVESLLSRWGWYLVLHARKL